MRNISRLINIPEWRIALIITLGPLYFRGKHPSAPKSQVIVCTLYISRRHRKERKFSGSV